MSEPRIILFDIETMPDLKEVMRFLPKLSDYPGLTLKASINSVICFGYQIFGEKEVKCVNAWDFKSWNKNVNDDKNILIEIRKVLENADALVTHNGKRFDLKFIQTRLLKHGLAPLPKILHVDTCQEAKKNLLMFNNRLNTISKFLTEEQKLENGGWELWEKVLSRDPKAMKLMTDYCKQDVRTLHAVFKVLRPFINTLPNYNLYFNLDRPVCALCGSTRIQKNGQSAARNKIRQRMTCKDCKANTYLDIKSNSTKTL